MGLTQNFSDSDVAYQTTAAAPFGLKTALGAINGLEREMSGTPAETVRPHVVHLTTKALSMFAADHPAIEKFGRTVAELCTLDANGNKGLRIAAHDQMLAAFRTFNDDIKGSPDITLTESGRKRAQTRETATEVYYNMAHSGLAPISYQPAPFQFGK